MMTDEPTIIDAMRSTIDAIDDIIEMITFVNKKKGSIVTCKTKIQEVMTGDPQTQMRELVDYMGPEQLGLFTKAIFKFSQMTKLLTPQAMFGPDHDATVEELEHIRDTLRVAISDRT